MTGTACSLSSRRLGVPGRDPAARRACESDGALAGARDTPYPPPPTERVVAQLRSPRVCADLNHMPQTSRYSCCFRSGVKIQLSLLDLGFQLSISHVLTAQVMG